MENNNIILNDRSDLIGYYCDLTKSNKECMKNAIDMNDYEQVETLVEIQNMLDDYKEYNGLLVISENNGMGFTVSKYSDYKEI